MSKIKFIVLILSCAVLTYSQRVSLIGSHYMPLKSSYKAFLFTSNLEPDSHVTVKLSGKGYSKSLSFDNFDKNSFNEVEFEVPGQKLKEYTIKVTSDVSGACMNQAVKIANLLDFPLIYIYLDKPIYKAGDDLLFRIFLLDQKMLPLIDQSTIDVKIYDSDDKIVQNFSDLRTMKFAFVEKTFKIPAGHHFGNWRIEVQTNARKKSKSFKVQQNIEDSFDVFVDSPNMVAYEDREFKMTLHFKDKNDKFFIGTAKISMEGKIFGSSTSVRAVVNENLAGNKKEISLKFDKHLNIMATSDDMYLTFNIEVTDSSTNNVVKVTKEIKMINKGRNIFQVIRKRFFKPGFEFRIKIRAKVVDGQIDNSLNRLKLKVEYENKDREVVNTKSSEFNLKNGEASTILEPTKDTNRIKLEIEIGKSKRTEFIEKFSTYDADEYMNVNLLSKSPKIGDTVQLEAKTTHEFEALHLLVFGINGLIYNEEFADAVGRDLHTFKIELTEEMKPEIRGLVFYIRPSDGLMIYDEFSISLGFSIGNFLEISAPSEAKPNDEVPITVKSEQGSFIFLTAIDQNSDLFNNENEISRSDVYNELIYYLNKTFQNTHEYKFEKVNSYVLEPIQKGTDCGKNLIMPGSSNPSVTSDETWTQKYFPNIWFDKAFEMDSGDQKVIRMKVPTGIKTWKIYGISIHPRKGFTVIKTKPEITVKSDIAIHIDAPSKIAGQEVFKVDIRVFSYNQYKNNAPVQIQIENGYIQDPVIKTFSGRYCYNFRNDFHTSRHLTFNLKPGEMSETKSFILKPAFLRDLKIKASELGGTENEKIIQVSDDVKLIKIKNNFDIDSIIRERGADHATLEILTKLIRNDVHGSNTKLEVELPKGYKFTSHDDADHIESIDPKSDDQTVILNMNNMDYRKQYRTIVHIEKKFEFFIINPSTIKLYVDNQNHAEDVFPYIYSVNDNNCKFIEENRCGFFKKIFGGNCYKD